MPQILAYIQPARTFAPVSGVGRHINGMLLALARRPDHNVELLFGRQWLEADDHLPTSASLRDLPFRTFALPERLLERSWKLCGRPRLPHLLREADLVYSPADVVFPRLELPSLVTLHDIHPLDPTYPEYDASPGWNSQRRRWEHWVPKLFASATVVLTVSDFCRRRMESLVETGGKPIHVIGNGVDPVFFDIALRDPSTCRRPGPWPYALMVGGLTDRKGAETTLRVAEALRQRGSEIRIVVAGRSEPKWSALAKDHPNVVELGPLEDNLLAEHLRAAGCLLFLSMYEGFGIPIIEAFAAGVPAIVSDTSSLPEVAGEAGSVFPAGETTAIAKRMETLVHEGCERHRAIEAGQERAKEFTWDACVDRLLAAFQAAKP